MKLSFSTFGWTSCTWNELCSMAEDIGFAGIEIHNIHEPIFSGKSGIFDPSTANAAYRDMSERGIRIPCIDTSCDIADPSKKDEAIGEISTYIENARSLHIPYVRIGARNCGADKDIQKATTEDVIKATLSLAQKHGITLLVETIAAYSDTKFLCEVLDIFACDNLGALWDMQHTVRTAEESPETTVKNLGAYIKHVHLKDSEVVNGQMEYRLIGEGSLPIGDMVRSLYSIN